MRTTITFEPDVAAAIEQERQRRGVGVSKAVNDLVRRGLVAQRERRPVTLPTSRIGLKIDVSNIEEALEIAEGPWHR